jgi:hypothetical protein
MGDPFTWYRGTEAWKADRLLRCRHCNLFQAIHSMQVPHTSGPGCPGFEAYPLRWDRDLLRRRMRELADDCSVLADAFGPGEAKAWEALREACMALHAATPTAMAGRSGGGV